ncbi:MAG: FG-GAP-like repeat-containing protein, partial [Nitrospirota bacterium]
NRPVQIGGALDWASVAAGWNYTIAIKRDRSLWAWGYTYYGRLSYGMRMSRNIPTRIGVITDWASVAAGRNHAVVIQTNGSLWAWGDNSNGQLGDGTTWREFPVKITLPVPLLILSEGIGGGKVIGYFDDGTINGKKAFTRMPFGTGFTGGINITTGDIDGDGFDEYIVAAASGDGFVKGYEYDGKLIFKIRPFGTGFRGGINIAAGDIDGDMDDEVIVGMSSNGTRVKVYEYNGTMTGNMIFNKNTFGRGFAGGVSIATGDWDGDGDDEIMTGMASSGQKVRAYDYNGTLGWNKLFQKIQTFGPGFTGGVSIATGDYYSNGYYYGWGYYYGKEEIFIAQATGGAGVKGWTNNRMLRGSIIFKRMSPFGPAYTGGVNITMADLSGTGGKDIIISMASGKGKIKGFSDNSTLKGDIILTIADPFGAGFTGGTKVTESDFNSDGIMDVAGTTALSSGSLKIWENDGTTNGNMIMRRSITGAASGLNPVFGVFR